MHSSRKTRSGGGDLDGEKAKGMYCGTILIYCYDIDTILTDIDTIFVRKIRRPSPRVCTPSTQRVFSSSAHVDTKKGICFDDRWLAAAP